MNEILENFLFERNIMRQFSVLVLKKFVVYKRIKSNLPCDYDNHFGSNANNCKLGNENRQNGIYFSHFVGK